MITIQVWSDATDAALSEAAQSVEQIEVHRYSEHEPIASRSDYSFTPASFISNSESIRKYIMRCLTLNQRIVVKTERATIDVADESQLNEALRVVRELLEIESKLSSDKKGEDHK